MENKYGNNMLIIYDCQAEVFTYTDAVKAQFEAEFDERPLWRIFKEDGLMEEAVAEEFHSRLREVADANIPQVQFAEYVINGAGKKEKKYHVGFVCPVPGKQISITFQEVKSGHIADCCQVHTSEYDLLTGLLCRSALAKAVEAIIEKDEAGAAAGEYALVYFDVIRFKAINDIYGMERGDLLLKYIADIMKKSGKEEDAVCRLDADRFVLFTHSAGTELEMLVERILDKISKYDLPFEVTCNVGIYVTEGTQLSVDSMIDRAVLAQSSIKGSYTSKYNYYTESMRNAMLSEQEISGIMMTALAEKQFVNFYQPQYNHSTGMLVGAEALVRWIHPERGMISPGVFIPIFEKNGFITKLDLYVFEQVCCFIRQCMDKGLPIVPISSNFSRYDIFQPNFVGKLEELRKKYDVPVKYLRVEITESVVVGGSQHANDIVRQLHECGYIVEMDDFGSGYSSLFSQVFFPLNKGFFCYISQQNEP